MSEINWLEKLNWGEDHIDDLALAGYAYIRQGKYDIAIRFYKALVVLDPSDAYYAQTLAGLYMQLGKPEKALPYFDIALKLEGDHAPTMINLCKTLFMLGRTEEGLRLAELLKSEPIPSISNQAKALILAYSRGPKS